MIQDATAIIEAFGLSPTVVLSPAERLASFRGTLKDAALTICKAALGSAEGYDVLRSFYGVNATDFASALDAINLRYGVSES